MHKKARAYERRWNSLSPTLHGTIWVALAGLFFVIFATLVRYVGSTLPPVEAAFIRYALGIVVLVPFFLRKRSVLHSKRIPAHALRGMLHALGVMLWFYAVAKMPIAEVMALSFTAPLFVTLGASVFLGEKLSTHRVFAVLVGFLGTLIILRPGVAVIDAAAWSILLSAPLFAGSKLLAKTLVSTDSSETVVAYLSIFATLIMLPPALLVWQTPTSQEFAFLLGTAVFATLSHLCLAQGLRLIDVTVAQPIEFLQLLWATLAGFMLFSETPDILVWTGAAVIVASATFIARREVLLSRKAG